MSLADKLQEELVRGVEDGRREAIAEAPTLTQVAGLKNPNYEAMKNTIYLSSMPYPVLGQTGITKSGDVQYVAVNSNIPRFAVEMMNTYRKSPEWAINTVYNIAKLTTEHELAHVQSSCVAKGEEFSKDTVTVMESVTTYAKHKTAKKLGKHEKADVIAATNPYPRAWWLGAAADWAPYSGPSGEGYAAFMSDVQKEPFYKPLWRLGKAAAKAAIRKGRDYLRGTEPATQAA